MESLILHALRQRAKYNALHRAVPSTMVSPDTVGLLQWFGAYFAAFPEREEVQYPELVTFIKLRAAKADPASVAITLALVRSVAEEKPDEVAISGILGQLYELELAGRAGALLSQYNAGEEVELAYELQRLSQDVVRAKAASSPLDYCDTPIDEILAEVADDKGLKFSFLPVLTSHIAGLSGGASVAIAARPDRGKTSFISQVVTCLAPQVVQMYGGRRPILWLNNEGSSKRIIPRIYQAALGMNLNEIIALSNKGKLIPKFAKAIGGVPDLIRVKDMHSASLAQIEQVIEAQNPAVVIGDMMANFRLGGGATGANKADLIEQIWQQWREILVRHDCVGFGTVQISVEGENQAYPSYSALKDSKTALQGATDIILMMGSLTNPDAATLRWLSTPKNKFQVPGKPSCLQTEVYFDAERCQFSPGSGG